MNEDPDNESMGKLAVGAAAFGVQISVRPSPV
jgi:hypothetical protein